jgi:SecD/SecF fusion protein
VVPILIGIFVVGRAFSRYEMGEGGFNLGVDLVGGTILVYEVDQSHWPDGKVPPEYSVAKLTAKLKQRIDPADLYNVTIRPLSDTRVEIILPTGGRKYAEHQEEVWHKLIAALKEKWPPASNNPDAYDVPLGQRKELIDAVSEAHRDDKNFNIDDVAKFIDEQLPARPKSGEKRRSMTGEQVQRVKELISRVGSLKFVIVANMNDDSEGIKAAEDYYGTSTDKPGTVDPNKLRVAALNETAPPPPPGGPFNAGDLGRFDYSWIELGQAERHRLGLDNDTGLKAGPGSFWKQMEDARNHHWVVLRQGPSALRTNLYYSREVVNPDRLPEKDRDKKYSYFVLCRNPGLTEDGRSAAVTGDYLVKAYPTEDTKRGGLAVGFTFNTQGANLLADLTKANKDREMAIVLDDQIQSAPNILEPITGGTGIITTGNSSDEVTRLVDILNSGALPATLKPQPVSENTMGPTLGQDTIYWGTVSVLVAFLAILAFMLAYYRFAGVVACIALFANLLLTVAVMVLINATFTLPGLAGLVLMLGMAVDANVLIYERLREERERGASLALAIRNGYDRAFPTIIDTHLSSIFTAVVLYVVGNDQLKGFGISLTLGLIISLFTSLYMTRLMFDFCLAKGWLKKLSFFGGLVRVLHARYWDFMSIRYYWFTATIILTILGASVFFYRLDKGGLNIDFMGGTKYSGLLKKGEFMTISDLRDALSEKEMRAKLAVEKVQPLDEQGNYRIFYKEGEPRDVYVNKNPDGTLVPAETGPDSVKARAEMLPDLSVEQIFLSDPDYSQKVNGKDASRLFTVRTEEKSPDIVQASITKLLAGRLEQTELTEFSIDKDGKSADLHFNDYASPAQVQMLVERQLRQIFGQGAVEATQFTLERLGKEEKEGRFKAMKLQLTSTGVVDKATLDKVLKAVQSELKERPQPESLENFDKQLAADTQLRALYAILASWGAILLYLWFRFGNWTFGLAAVLCLIHDLFFTLGFIGIAHYIHQVWPNNFLLIQDFKIDLQSVAALLTLVGYSVNDTIVVFDRIREVRGKNPELTPKMINDGVNQTLSRTLLTALSVWLVVIVLYFIGGEGVHLFAFVMVVGVIVGTYSSIYIASPLLLIFGEGKARGAPQRQPVAIADPSLAAARPSSCPIRHPSRTKHGT